AAYCSDMLDNWNYGIFCNNIPGTVFTQTISARSLDIIFQTFAFVSVNKINHEIVISFRGSINPLNIFQVIFQAELVQYGTDPLAKVHKGFLASFNSLKDEIRSVITKLIVIYKGYEIIVTGHSLGGNMAILGALDIKQSFQGTNPHLYTYGSLRSGNTFFANFVNKNL
ncbi:30870_t:CDS:2, partial [Gigaspora margarita]